MEKVYRIEPSSLQNVKDVIEADDIVEEGEKKINQFARQGYDLRDSQSLGFEEEGSYLYIKAGEDFFEENEGEINLEGVEELERDEKKKVIKKMKEEKDQAAKGMGAIFG